MAQIPVSIGIPALVLRKKSHVVSMVEEGRLELIRRIPYIVIFGALVVGNLAYVGAGPFVGLRNRFGYAMIADAALLILAFSILAIGKRKRITTQQLSEPHAVFLPEWTYAMLLSVLAGLVLPLI